MKRVEVLLVIAAAALALIAVGSATATPPTETLTGAQASGSDSETLSGTINAHACKHGTGYWAFEYGSPKDANHPYDANGTDEFSGLKGGFVGVTPSAPQPIGSFDDSSSADQPESSVATGLQPGLVYYWRLVASDGGQPGETQPAQAPCDDGSAAGVTTSDIQCFTAGAGPTPCPVEQTMTFHVVNQRGRTQVASVFVSTNGGGGFDGHATNGSGDFSLTVHPGDVLHFTRSPIQHGGDCTAPEGSVSTTTATYTVPASPPANVTITLPNATGPAYKPELSPAERWVIGQINKERSARGLGALHISTALTRAADAVARESALIRKAQGRYPWPPKYCDAIATDWGWPTPYTMSYTGGAAGEDDATTDPRGALGHWTDSSARGKTTFDSRFTAVGIGDGDGSWVMLLSDCNTARNPAAGRCEMTSDTGDASINLPAASKAKPKARCGKRHRCRARHSARAARDTCESTLRLTYRGGTSLDDLSDSRGTHLVSVPASPKTISFNKGGFWRIPNGVTVVAALHSIRWTFHAGTVFGLSCAEYHTTGMDVMPRVETGRVDVTSGPADALAAQVMTPEAVLHPAAQTHEHFEVQRLGRVYSEKGVTRLLNKRGSGGMIASPKLVAGGSPCTAGQSMQIDSRGRITNI